LASFDYSIFGGWLRKWQVLICLDFFFFFDYLLIFEEDPYIYFKLQNPVEKSIFNNTYIRRTQN